MPFDKLEKQSKEYYDDFIDNYIRNKYEYDFTS